MMAHSKTIVALAMGLAATSVAARALAQQAAPGLTVAAGDTAKVQTSNVWLNTTWKDVNRTVSARKTFEVERATAVAGVRGIEAEDITLDRLYYRGGGKYPTRLELKNAVDVLEKTLAEAPDSPDAPKFLFYIGQCYAQLGQKAQAKAAYERLLKEHPDSDLAKGAQVELAQLGDVKAAPAAEGQKESQAAPTAPTQGR